MEKLGFSKRILEMNFMKNTEKGTKNKKNNDTNEAQWEISIPQIEKIVDMRINNLTKCVEYLVKWVGFPEEENTWEPKENLVNCKEAIEDFEKEQKKKKNEKNDINNDNYSRSSSKSSSSSNIKNSNNIKYLNKKRNTTMKLNNNLNNNTNKNILSSNNNNSNNNLNKIKKIGKKSPKNFSSSNDEENSSSSSSTENYGNIEKDIPKKIVSVSIVKSGIKPILSFEIEWEKRKNNFKPKNSMYKNNELRNSKKGLNLLVDYYESHIQSK